MPSDLVQKEDDGYFLKYPVVDNRVENGPELRFQCFGQFPVNVLSTLLPGAYLFSCLLTEPGQTSVKLGKFCVCVIVSLQNLVEL